MLQGRAVTPCSCPHSLSHVAVVNSSIGAFNVSPAGCGHSSTLWV